MKTFKEYLSESKKVYPFKIKVAGELPEGFVAKLKSKLECHSIATFEDMGTTPIQKLPLDFPTKTNCEVTVFDIVLEYPVTTPELIAEVKSLGIDDDCFRVRGSNEPSEADQITAGQLISDTALLNDSQYKEETKIKHKEYFGDDFNNSFLKDLAKAAKERKKDNGTNVEYKLPKQKQTKGGNMAPLSDIDNPNPVKG